METLIGGGHVVVLLGREHASGTAVGVAVMRVQPSLWSNTQEAYLAELYVTPNQRGRGYGRELYHQGPASGTRAQRHIRVPHHQ